MKKYIFLLLTCFALLTVCSVSASDNSPGKRESKTNLSKEKITVEVIATPSNIASYMEVVRSDGYRQSDYNSTIKNEKSQKAKDFIATAYRWTERRRQQHFDYGTYLIDKTVKVSKLINAPPCNI